MNRFRFGYRRALFWGQQRQTPEWKVSLKIFGWFALFWLGGVIFPRLPDIISGTAPSFDYPLTATNMAGVLGFQFLLSGTAEEPLFRGMVMVVLAKYLRGTYRIGKVEIPSAGIAAAVFFALAHVNSTIFPLAITSLSVPQLFSAFGFGIYFAIVFHRTGSLLGPIISHGYANGILFAIPFTMAFLFS